MTQFRELAASDINLDKSIAWLEVQGACQRQSLPPAFVHISNPRYV